MAVGRGGSWGLQGSWALQVAKLMALRLQTKWRQQRLQGLVGERRAAALWSCRPWGNPLAIPKPDLRW